MAINQLGNGLSEVEHHEDALIVGEAELAMERRRGAPKSTLLTVQSNIASTYQMLGRPEEALKLKQSVYSRFRMLHGDEHEDTLKAASNCASTLVDLQRFEEARELLHTTTLRPSLLSDTSVSFLCHRNLWVASRILGEEHRLTLKMRWIYAEARYKDVGSTLGDLREAVSTLEDTDQIAPRVFGSSHPIVVNIEQSLRKSRAILSTRADAARAGTSIYSLSTPTPAAESAPAFDFDAAPARAETAHEEDGADASAAEDPNADLKAEIAQLEAQLTEKRHELSRRTGAPKVMGVPALAAPPTTAQARARDQEA